MQYMRYIFCSKKNIQEDSIRMLPPTANHLYQFPFPTAVG